MREQPVTSGYAFVLDSKEGIKAWPNVNLSLFLPELIQ